MQPIPQGDFIDFDIVFDSTNTLKQAKSFPLHLSCNFHLYPQTWPLHNHHHQQSTQLGRRWGMIHSHQHQMTIQVIAIAIYAAQVPIWSSDFTITSPTSSNAWINMMLASDQAILVLPGNSMCRNDQPLEKEVMMAWYQIPRDHGQSHHPSAGKATTRSWPLNLRRSK